MMVTHTNDSSRPMRTLLRTALVFAGMSVGLLAQTPAVAQHTPDSQTSLSGHYPPTIPILGGHRFAGLTTMPSPFTGTFVRNSLGAGMSSGLEFPPIVIGGREIPVASGELAFSQLKFEYQQSVKDWLAPFLTVQLFGRLGTETQSLISQGVTFVTGFELGWLFKIWRSDDMILSGSLSLLNLAYGAVDLSGFIHRAIEEGEISPDNTLYRESPMALAGTGVRYAYAVNEMLGITAFATLAYGESADRYSENRWYHRVGISTDFDFGPRHGVPIGLAAAFTQANLGSEQGNALGNTGTLTLRISHTGSPSFNFGLELSSLWQKLEGLDNAFRYSSAIIDFQYYF